MHYTDEQLATAVDLWERLVNHPNVRGETQGYYEHSHTWLSPKNKDRHRMPNTDELRALVLSDGEETEHPARVNVWSGDKWLYPIELTLISCGDYHGSDLDAANNRALAEQPGVTVRYPNTGGMGSIESVSTVIVGEMSSFANAQGEQPNTEDAIMWLSLLVDTMYGLLDYPLIDEDVHSEYIDQLADEAWDAWLRFDTIAVLGIDWADEHEDLIRSAYYSYENNEWVAESATSVYNARHAEAVEYVRRTI